MRARIEQLTMGFHVRLSGGKGEDFQKLLDTFKKIIPRACRRFQGRYWFVDRRAYRRLEQFASAITGAGGKVDR